MEQTPSQLGPTPELPSLSPPSNKEMAGAFSNPEAPLERQERGIEGVSRVEQAAAPPLVVPLPTPVMAPIDDTAVTGVADDDMPSLASDEELIEKEWVVKAKKVLAETKDDPYRREQEVGRLQADYLAKRYGRELGASSEQ